MIAKPPPTTEPAAFSCATGRTPGPPAMESGHRRAMLRRPNRKPPLPPTRARVHLALITVSLLFGANYVFTKRILGAVPASSWVLFRIAAATLVLVPLALRFGRGRPPLRLFGGLCLAALLGVVLNQILFTEGLALTRPEHSAVINACIPTWTLCLAVLFGQERFTPRRLLAVTLALAGVLTLFKIDQILGGHVGIGRDEVRGDLLTLANGVAFALHLILMRRLGAGLDPWIATALMFAASTAMVSVYSLPQLSLADIAAVTTTPVCWFAIYAVLFATVLTYSLNTWALKHTHSSQVALYINVQPLVAVALGPFFAMPAPDWRFFVALGGVAAGLWLQTTAR